MTSSPRPASRPIPELGCGGREFPVAGRFDHLERLEQQLRIGCGLRRSRPRASAARAAPAAARGRGRACGARRGAAIPTPLRVLEHRAHHVGPRLARHRRAATGRGTPRGRASRRRRARAASSISAQRRDAAVDHELERREIALQPVHVVVLERRDLAVLLRRQALQQRVARMDDEGAAARLATPCRRSRARTRSSRPSSMPMRCLTVTGSSHRARASPARSRRPAPAPPSGRRRRRRAARARSGSRS